MAKSILFVNKNVFSVSLCSKYENTIVIILTSGSAIIKPDKIGFFNESQLAKEIIKAENKTFKTKIIIVLKSYHKLYNLSLYFFLKLSL